MSQIRVSAQPDKFPYEISVHARKRIDERDILLKWIQETIEKPDKKEPHKTDPELEIAFKKIESCSGRVLKIVYKTTVSPFKIVTTYFDRNKKGKL